MPICETIRGLEKRVLQYFAEKPELSSADVTAAGMESEIQLMCAVRDGSIQKVKEDYPPDTSFSGGYTLAYLQLPSKGRILLKDGLIQKKRFNNKLLQ